MFFRVMTTKPWYEFTSNYTNIDNLGILQKAKKQIKNHAKFLLKKPIILDYLNILKKVKKRLAMLLIT